MIDWRKQKQAPEALSCPVPNCGGMMQLEWDTYTCPKCEHFWQDPSLQDVAEDDSANLKFCNCEYCQKENGGYRL
jgi:hypothetical protein